MNQQTLQMEDRAMEVELQDELQVALPAVIRQPPEEFSDLRAFMMGKPSGTMDGWLSEFMARRNKWRDWLLKQLIPGVHFGFVPGTEPETQEMNGEMHWKMRYKNKKDEWCEKWVPYSTWTPKPPFHIAGADFVCEVMCVKDLYDADLEHWQMLGSPKGTIVTRCRLYAHSDIDCKAIIGEGRGARRVGQKGGDENNAIKMAEKASKVDATLHAFALRDLFTQDGPPDTKPPAHENPTASETPRTQPRGERVTKDDCRSLYKQWQAWRQDIGKPDDRSEFEQWAAPLVGIDTYQVPDPNNWTRDGLSKCREAIGGGR